MSRKYRVTRRSGLKSIGALGAAALLGSGASAAGAQAGGGLELGGTSSDVRRKIFEKVQQTPFVDTHEHLIEEKERLKGTAHAHVPSDDWSLLVSHYLNSDLITAGMPSGDVGRFFSPEVEPVDKWPLIEPYWPAVKNTGYGQAVVLSMRQLYGVDSLSTETVKKVQAGYERTRRAGFYRRILCEEAKIESCQVNSLGGPFMESDMPTLLMQDISIVGMFAGGGGSEQFRGPTGIEVASLGDWHKVIDWWFAKYAKYAVAVKSQDAYAREIDYARVGVEEAAGIFKKKVQKQPLSAPEKKTLEDHLFWYAVEKATENRLPVKLHTGYYAGRDNMPLARLGKNPGSACELCKASPGTPFVFMHIGYPYYEEMIALAKHYTNAHIDMCWSWIINPVGAKDFLKKYLVTAPANKILTFGGDYIPVEPVLGHAMVTRRGIGLALSELVEEGWLSLDAALELTDPIMHGNARRIFRLEEKEKVLHGAGWGKT